MMCSLELRSLWLSDEFEVMCLIIGSTEFVEISQVLFDKFISILA